MRCCVLLYTSLLLNGLAEAVFQNVVQRADKESKFVIDSAGTGGGKSNWFKPGVESYHTGNKADARMIAAAAKRGITLTSRSRPMRYIGATSCNTMMIIQHRRLADYMLSYRVGTLHRNSCKSTRS
jgi:protein-tyrosine-phosphatase